jgi:hypothetical protein
MARALIYRKGWLASLPGFLLALVGLGGLALCQFLLTISVAFELDVNDPQGIAGTAGSLVYFFGIIVITLLMIWYRKDLKRWFPQRGKAAKVPAQQPQAAG